MSLYRLRQPGDPDNSMTVEWYYPDEDDVFEEFNPNIEAAIAAEPNPEGDLGPIYTEDGYRNVVRNIVVAALTPQGDTEQ